MTCAGRSTLPPDAGVALGARARLLLGWATGHTGGIGHGLPASATAQLLPARALRPLFRQLLAIELANDPGHVGMGFAIGRHSMIFRHPLRTRIVGGQRLGHVAM